MDLAWTLVILSLIVLVSYVFDLVSKHLRTPAVVLLIFTGMALRAASDAAQMDFSPPEQLLPVLGTFGLILIVLEGALDLVLSKDKVSLITRTFFCSVLGILATGSLCAALFQSYFDIPLLTAWVYATPFAVISSAVAIPAAGALIPRLREFVVYESSFSDIFGVILFYALLRSQGSFTNSFLEAVFSMSFSAAIGVVAALLLYGLIKRIDTHVRFLPMIFGIALFYGIGKLLHLAPLVMVLLVGLLLNNNRWMSDLPILRKGNQEEFDIELDSLKHLTAEFTFVVRTFFFVLLGYSIQLIELLNPLAWGMAITIVACCVVPRIILIRLIAAEKINSLLWFAPRGLITILLILSIPNELKFDAFPFAVVLLVVLIWALLLTIGLIRNPPVPGSESNHGKKNHKPSANVEPTIDTPDMPVETKPETPA